MKSNPSGGRAKPTFVWFIILAAFWTPIVLVVAAKSLFAGEIVKTQEAGQLVFAEHVTGWAPQNLVLSAGKGKITINLQTGQVDLPKDMSLSDAAVAFWLRVAQVFPECRQAILTGDPTPKTIMWGEDFAKKHPTILPKGTTITKYQIISIRPGGGVEYELGLRSDGVVVWREVK